MAVQALSPDYTGVPRDAEENFHGNRLLYLHWRDHLMFCAPFCIPVSPDMRFAVLRDEVLPSLYGSHPDFVRIDWKKVQWQHGQDAWMPDPTKSLADNGLVHKSLVQFRTPGLTGIAGSGT
ncbi:MULTISPECIES: phenol hydroxylase subunit P4 [Rhodanobacter]|uniref:phenol hydroxylase subunit P4 n=1 Tax=Rhodanobacter TaxID=75309 RepID=UPI000412647B|nr:MULTISPECIES: phenol hydroxylase subunit P4 [Rhodanobacter]UJJ53361.1 phenol hydroxylase subunit P4 [Rhodanobacter thiooxydans]